MSSNFNSGAAQFAVSAKATHLCVFWQGQTNIAPIRWLDQTGKTSLLAPCHQTGAIPRFRRTAASWLWTFPTARRPTVWIYDWARDTLSKLTFDAADDARPVWTPDGSRIVFASRRGDKSIFNLYWQRADGTGDVQRLTESKGSKFATSWHPRWKVLAFFETGAGTSSDIWFLPIEGR